MDKKGKKPKEMYEIGEVCLVQDMAIRQWSKQATVISIRTALDGTVVSYLLDINGYQTARHRRYMRKLNIPEDHEGERAGLRETGLDSDREGSQANRQPVGHEEPQLRRSDRLRAGQHGI